MTDGFSNMPLVSQGRPQVIIGLCKIGLEAQGFQILFDRFLRLALATQGIPQVIMRLRIPRPPAQRFIVIVRCLGEPFWAARSMPRVL